MEQSPQQPRGNIPVHIRLLVRPTIKGTCSTHLIGMQMSEEAEHIPTRRHILGVVRHTKEYIGEVNLTNVRIVFDLIDQIIILLTNSFLIGSLSFLIDLRFVGLREKLRFMSDWNERQVLSVRGCRRKQGVQSR